MSEKPSIAGGRRAKTHRYTPSFGARAASLSRFGTAPRPAIYGAKGSGRRISSSAARNDDDEKNARHEVRRWGPER